MNQAIQHIEANNLQSKSFILVGSNNWSKGLVGIVAGRIKDIFHKPTCVYSVDNNGVGTASGRSVSGIHLGNIVLRAKQEGLLLKGGGHSQAVGFSFDINRLTEIEDYFHHQINLQIKRGISADYYVDETLSLSAVNNFLLKELDTLEPFGMAFNEPIFKIKSVFVKDVKTIGKQQNHLSFWVSDGIKSVKGVCFKVLPSKLGTELLQQPRQPVDLIVTVKPNFYRGNVSPQLHVLDFRHSSAGIEQ